MNIEAHDPMFGLMLTCAVRYTLGRRTYMVSTVIDFITPLLPDIASGTLICLERDISRTQNLGDEIVDQPRWEEFLANIRREIRKRGC